MIKKSTLDHIEYLMTQVKEANETLEHYIKEHLECKTPAQVSEGELIMELIDNCQASIADPSVPNARIEYRKDLLSRAQSWFRNRQTPSESAFDEDEFRKLAEHFAGVWRNEDGRLESDEPRKLELSGPRIQAYVAGAKECAKRLTLLAGPGNTKGEK
jgi:hypothetical protein